jgi:hypothetical protein
MSKKSQPLDSHAAKIIDELLKKNRDTRAARRIEAFQRKTEPQQQSTGSLPRNRDYGLFPSEPEVARRLSQDPRTWPSKAIVLERDGLPRIDPIMGGRYWPAVIAWWNRRYGLSILDVSQPDGKDNFDALR